MRELMLFVGRPEGVSAPAGWYLSRLCRV